MPRLASSRPPLLALLVPLTIAACTFDASGLGDAGGPATPGGVSGGPTGEPDGSSTSADPSATDPGVEGSGDAEAGSESATTEPLPPACGDGKLDPGEDCDAGPANQGGLACTPECTMNECGDSYLGAGEECDAGAGNQSGQGCTPACVLNVCGDGYLGAGELCDDGAGNGAGKPCTTKCTVAKCGDGEPGAGEVCDDGNTNNNDGCLNTCQAATCGDGFQQENVENCDLGAVNGEYGSGCSKTCDGPGPSCGNGMWDKMYEECEGGGAPQHADCESDCKISCDFGWDDCNNNPTDGCEANLNTTTNCAYCGHACPGDGNACQFYLYCKF